MKVDRLSATSLEAAMGCLARFKAEHQNYTKGLQGAAASFGTCVHDTLELFVKGAYLQDKFQKTWKQLEELWMMQYAGHYGGLKKSDADFKLGLKLLKRWHDRDDLGQAGRTILDCESKRTFPITVDGNVVTIVYKRDRLDQLDDGSIVVVDYKTSAWNVNHEDLKSMKVQPKIYALATQIEYPDAPGIWVEFDMLKHENQPVGVYFSQEDNKATWLALKAEIRKIMQAPDDPPPTLNSTCLFCPLKTNCSAVLKNANNGGALNHTREEMVDKLVLLKYQESAAKAAQKELETLLLGYAKEDDAMLIEGNDNDLAVSVSKRRSADGERVQRIIGPQLWDKYGSATVTMAVIDVLLKGDELSPEQKRELKESITIGTGEPSLKPKARTALEAQ